MSRKKHGKVNIFHITIRTSQKSDDSEEIVM